MELETALRQVTHALIVADLASAAVDLAVKEVFVEEGLPEKVREAMQLRATAVTANDQAIQTTIYSALKLYQVRREKVVGRLNGKIATSLRTKARQSGESDGYMLSQELVDSCMKDLHDQDKLYALSVAPARKRAASQKRNEHQQFEQYDESADVYYSGAPARGQQSGGQRPFRGGNRGKGPPQKPKQQQYSGGDRGAWRGDNRGGNRGGPYRGPPKGQKRGR